MKNLNIFAILAIVLAVSLAGCTTNTPPTTPGPTNPGPVVATPQCAEYCPTLPHIQCVGRWNISGTYPSCSCDFVCDTGGAQPPPPVPAQGQDPGTNRTTPPVNPPPAVQPEAPTTFYASLSEALNAQIDRQKTDFYNDAGSGRFSDSTQYWNVEYQITSPDEIPIVSENLGAPSVVFGRIVNRSERAFAFTNFTQDGVAVGRRGILIFSDESQELETPNQQFGLEYLNLRLQGCRVYETEREIIPPGSRMMKTYYFGCESAFNVN